MDNSETNYKVVNDSLLRILRCYFCPNMLTSPIYMCRNGHNVCQICSQKFSLCFLCKTGFNSRNQTMEEVAQIALFPCSNESDGCTAKLHLKDKVTHEKECDFRPFRCLLSGCKWMLHRRDYILHLALVHNTKLIIGSYHEIHVPLIREKSEWLLFAFNRYVLLRFIVDDTSVYLRMAIYLEGVFEESTKYYFIFRVKHHTNPYNSIKYTSTFDSLEMGQFVLALPVARMYCLKTDVHLVPLEVNMFETTSEKEEEKQEEEQEEKQEEEQEEEQKQEQEQERMKKNKKKQKKNKDDQEVMEEEMEKKEEQKNGENKKKKKKKKQKKNRDDQEVTEEEMEKKEVEKNGVNKNKEKKQKNENGEKEEVEKDAKKEGGEDVRNEEKAEEQ